MSFHCQLTTPLGPQALLLQSLTAHEGLSSLGEATLGLLSSEADVSPDALLGKPVSLCIEGRDDAKRYLSGYAVRFSQTGFSGRFHAYTMTVRPWLWLLTRTADCRIFQDLSVPDIVKAVFHDHPVGHFEFKLFRSYRVRNYCVQYRESDYNFVARLLEQEGIYWFVDHADGDHKLVLCDSASAHDPHPGCESLPYHGEHSEPGSFAKAPTDIDCVARWMLSRGIETGKVVIADYDFERPSATVRAEHAQPRQYVLSDAEVFDYPGNYLQAADGKQYAEDRIDEIQSAFEVFTARSNAQAIHTGAKLDLTHHPREDQNATYLVTATRLHLEQPVHESAGGRGDFACEFSAIRAAQQYRPPRRTPKPSISGPQTATVTGPAGEELFTDKYGRVKVKFPWDRAGDAHEKSSCWVSVASPWAGSQFGMVQVPRIGQEVVVSFLEGDPDRPLIVGRTWNAANMPPWTLPANATQSGILTRSSKGGGYGNANAIRFEDKKGAEQLWLHAEKNQDIEVEADETHWVGHDRSKTVDHDETVQVKHDRTETVGNNETITVGVNRTEHVGSNEVIGIGANRTETVGANESITIGANRSISVGASETATVALQRTHAVGINETITIGAAQQVAIGAMQSVTVGAVQTISVGASQSTTVGTSQTNSIGAGQTNTIGAAQSNTIGAAQSTSVGADCSWDVSGAHSSKVGKGRSADVAEDDAVKVGKNLVIDAGDSISIKTGSASITMKKDGTISIKGKDITVEGSGKINVKASSDVVIKGSKVLQN